jgi:hypothetical protein
MVIACSLQCFLVLAAGCLSAAAQVTQPQVLDLPSEVPLAVPQAERSKINLLTMGWRVSSDFDDNALNGNQSQQGDLVASIQPRLGWQVFRPRMEWAVDYTPGLYRSQNFSAYDSLSHVLDGRFQVNLTKRLRLLVRESFLKSANPFDQLQAFGTTAGAPDRAVTNEMAPVTPAEVRAELAKGEILYALSAHGTVGVGGEFFSGTYSLPSRVQLPNQVLQDSSSVAGHGYYMRQVTRHQWTGLEYDGRKSIFNSGQSWSLLHSLVFTHTITLSPPLTLAFFVGPERSVAQNMNGTSLSPIVTGQQTAWHWSGGVTGRWSAMHTSITAAISRKLSNGGVLGDVQLSRASAELTRQLGRQWSAGLLAAYDDSRSLAGSGALSYASVACGLTYRLGPNLSLQLRYWREHVSGSSSLPAGFLADHNRIAIALSYELEYPLGR